MKRRMRKKGRANPFCVCKEVTSVHWARGHTVSQMIPLKTLEIYRSLIFRKRLSAAWLDWKRHNPVLLKPLPRKERVFSRFQPPRGPSGGISFSRAIRGRFICIEKKLTSFLRNRCQQLWDIGRNANKRPHTIVSNVRFNLVMEIPRSKCPLL